MILPMRCPCPRRPAGFTLLELMIVVAVIGILAMVAYPSYMDVVVRNNRSVARAALTDLVARQEAYFTQHKKYADTILDLGFPSSPTGLRNSGALDDLDTAPNPGDIVYKIQVSAVAPFTDDINFRVEAVPTNFQAQDNKCATLFITAAGTHGATGGDDCW